MWREGKLLEAFRIFSFAIVVSGESGGIRFFAGDSTGAGDFLHLLGAVVWSVAAGVVPLTRFLRSELVLAWSASIGWFQTWLAGKSGATAAKSVEEGKEEQLTYPVLEVRAVSRHLNYQCKVCNIVPQSDISSEWASRYDKFVAWCEKSTKGLKKACICWVRPLSLHLQSDFAGSQG